MLYQPRSFLECVSVIATHMAETGVTTTLPSESVL